MLFNRERALEFMTEFGLDALLATTRHNVLYLSGFQGWAQYTYGDATTETFAIFFRDTGVAPALIVSRQDETYYSATGSWIEDVRGYGPRSALDIEPGEQGATDEERNYLSLIGEGAPREANSVDALVRVLSERGISTGNIAIDNEGIRPASRASLEAAFPDISFHDGANL
ncbi:MAG: aminopeptidase P family N-terminal domain-containing protein, partial [Nitrospinota bacterium]|nr:aminopeptidase P family N-terminal domain-containing protein [Nitrospinota bacterium]